MPKRIGLFLIFDWEVNLCRQAHRDNRTKQGICGFRAKFGVSKYGPVCFAFQQAGMMACKGEEKGQGGWPG